MNMKLHSKALLKALVVLIRAGTQAAHAQVAQATGVIFENVRIFSGTSDRLSGPSHVLVVGNVIKTISSAPIAAPPETAVKRIEASGRRNRRSLRDSSFMINYRVDNLDTCF